MIYRYYGSTGISLSVIGFGGMRFENQDDPDDSAELVLQAYEKGINYFDTAPLYGTSENIFGIAFKEMKKSRQERPFFVSTKTFQENPDRVRADLEQSLKKMDLEYIDFYHVWAVLTPEAYQRRKAKGVLLEFEKLKEEGLIRHICVSTHMAGEDIGDMLRDYPFDGVLLGYSAMNFAYRDHGVATAALLKRGVVVMNPLGGGIIPNHPDRFDFVRTQENETVVQGALRFLINDPRITVALVGFSNQKQLAEAISAVKGFQPISFDQIENIKSGLNSSFDKLCTSCRYCDYCPVEIPLPQLMESYNHLELNPDYFLTRISLHWGLSFEEDYAARCIDCGLCETLCTQKLPIRERLKIVQQEISRRKEKNAAEQGG